MATRHVLSASTDGKPIPITTSASTGTLCHSNADSVRDEVFAWVTSGSNADYTLTYALGGTGAEDLVVVPVKGWKTVLICDGHRLGNGGTLRAWSTDAPSGTLRVMGYYNRLA